MPLLSRAVARIVRNPLKEAALPAGADDATAGAGGSGARMLHATACGEKEGFIYTTRT